MVSYTDRAKPKNLKVMHCNDANCDGGDEGITISDKAVSSTGIRFTSLTLDSSGFPVVSYNKVGNGRGFCGNLRVLHCGNPNC